MGGAWTYRVAKDDKGRLHFVCVSHRPEESRASGMTGIWNEGQTMEDMTRLADALRTACDQPVIDADGNEPDAGTGGDDDE